MPMPMPQKRRRRCRRGPLQQVHSRRRLGEDGESFPGSLVDSDSSSSSSTTSGSPLPAGFPDEAVNMSLLAEPMYHQYINWRLEELQLPVCDDGSDLADRSILPSTEILDALTRKSFHDDHSRAALVEYQCQSSLIEPRRPDLHGLDTDTGGESEPEEQLTLDEDYMAAREVLRSQKPEIDTYTKLDQEQTNQQHLKRALYIIRAALLLKGMPVEELDDAALEHKYPPELIVKHNFFLDYVNDGYFGWYFDHDLCYKEFLTDYQRLVLLNDGGNEYASWSRYRAFYSTPEADRDYLRYWEALAKKIKWIKKYVLTNNSYEWEQIYAKASVQAVRLAAEFSHMNVEVAGAGLSDFIWNARAYVVFVEDLDGIFYEIWRQVNADHQQRFRDALKQVYGEKLFPARDRTMKNELEHGSNLELLFRQCTGGLCKNVPEWRARELIRQEIHWRGGLSGTYAQYARKKLKIAELIGLISSDNIVSA